MSTPNWFATAMQMFGPKQEVVRPPAPKFTPKMAMATYAPQAYTQSKSKKRPSSGGSPSSKRKRKPEASLGLFGESTKRKGGSMENMSRKKGRRPSEPNLPLFGESKKRKGGAMFNPSKKSKLMSSKKRSQSLGSLENLFSKKARF